MDFEQKTADDLRAQQMQAAYAQQGAARNLYANASPVAPRPQRRLDSIASAADETARIAGRLDNLLGRFTGTENGADGCDDPIAISYSTQLDRLQANIGRIHKAIDEIEQYA